MILYIFKTIDQILFKNWRPRSNEFQFNDWMLQTRRMVLGDPQWIAFYCSFRGGFNVDKYV